MKINCFFPNWILTPFLNTNRFFSKFISRFKIHEVGYFLNKTDKDVYNLLDKSNPHLKFTLEEEILGEETLKKFGLKKILMPWHNLYLDDKKILNTKFKKIKLVKIHELCSTYYYYSRVINAALSKKESRKPKYKDHLNLLGWRASQDLIKGFSQLKMYEFKKV